MSSAAHARCIVCCKAFVRDLSGSVRANCYCRISLCLLLQDTDFFLQVFNKAFYSRQESSSVSIAPPGPKTFENPAAADRRVPLAGGVATPAAAAVPVSNVAWLYRQ